MQAVIEVKSSREIQKMRAACQVAAKVLAELASLVVAGMSCDELDRQAASRTARYAGAKPAFLGYRGFPANVCVSINSEVVHGIPTARKKINKGDVVSLDFGILLDGYYGDCATTVIVGEASAQAQKLVDVTREALGRAIDVVRDGARVGDIGFAVQSHVEANHMSVVRDFVGHGIGRNLHEEPAVPNWGTPGQGARLVEGMTIAIEPMVSLGGPEVFIAKDGWTAQTKDGSLAAHFEHTILVEKHGGVVLTEVSGD